ncbi:MAG: PLP-dependent aminotransferase family protein [Chloroflexota bacterium]
MIELTIDYKSEIPLNRQIYLQIREMILTGAVSVGNQLPSTREIAKHYEMARMTVNVAYEQLEVEGYVITRHGSGTFVNENLLLGHVNGNGNGNGHKGSKSRSSDLPILSDWAKRIKSQAAETPGRNPSEKGASLEKIDFGFDRSFAHIFPFDVWRKLLNRYLSTDDAILSRYGSVGGFEPLRQAIATYVTRQRGVNCSPDQVMIVNGIQQGIDILARILVNKRDDVLVETPGYTNAFKLFQAYGANLVGVPVDQNGFDPAKIPGETDAKLVFVTPSNQFPHGGAMPAERRLSLIDWARNNNALIIEDDYDGELRYKASPISALQGLDSDDRVIYLGSFSKVLLPALRLGYVILPPNLVDDFLRTKGLIDRGAPTLTQAAIADFITEGHFERHLRALRKIYAERRATLIHAIQAHLADKVTFADHPAGFHILLHLNDGVNEALVIKEAAKAGVNVYPGRPYHLDANAPATILLGFCGLENDQIVEGAQRLSIAIKAASPVKV